MYFYIIKINYNIQYDFLGNKLHTKHLVLLYYNKKISTFLSVKLVHN